MERRCPDCICPLGMLTSIKLNNELASTADEVSDVGTHRRLASKLVTTETAIAQLAPEHNFGICARAAELSGAGHIRLLHG
jgi:hypothetical protein